MNERIRELAEQAKVKVWHDGGGLLSDKAFEIVAELIVRECLDQCYYRGMNHDLYAGQLKAAEYIEQHFGVKE